MSNSLYEISNSISAKRLHLVAYYFVDWKNYYMDIHTHDRIEFMYVLSGTCKITVEQEICNLSKGDFIFIDAKIPHKLTVSGEKVCRMLNLEMVFRDTAIYHPSLFELAKSVPSLEQFIISKSPYLVLKDTGCIFPVIRNIINECDEKPGGFEVLVNHLLTELFIRTSRLISSSKSSSSRQNIYTEKAIRFLYQNYDRKILIEDIADHLRFHPSYLQRIFKQSTGKSIIEFLQNVRVEKAKMFISQSEVPISEIAFMTGFEDPKYFSSCFKKITGITPSSYRKKFKYWNETNTEN